MPPKAAIKRSAAPKNSSASASARASIKGKTAQPSSGSPAQKSTIEAAKVFYRKSSDVFVRIQALPPSAALSTRRLQDTGVLKASAEQAVTFAGESGSDVYTFPRKVLGPESTNDDVCGAVLHPLLEAFTRDDDDADGYNALLLAYSSLESGSCDMVRYMLLQVCDHVFHTMQKKGDRISFLLTASAAEFYKLQCFDLASRDETFIDKDNVPVGNRTCVVTGTDCLAKFLVDSQTSRSALIAKLASDDDKEGISDNDTSSRCSHTLVSLSLLQMDKAIGKFTKTTFSVVDLARVERPSSAELLKAVMELCQCNGLPESATRSTIINYEYHMMKASISQACKARDAGTDFCSDSMLTTPMLKFFSGCLSGKIMCNMLLTLPAGQCGWETRFALEYGAEMSRVNALICPVPADDFAKLVKRIGNAAAQAMSDPRSKADGPRKAHLHSLQQYLSHLEQVNGKDRAFDVLMQRRLKNSSAARALDNPFAVPRQEEDASSPCTVPQQVGSAAAVASPSSRLRGLSHCSECKNVVEDSSQAVSAGSADGRFLCEPCSRKLQESAPSNPSADGQTQGAGALKATRPTSCSWCSTPFEPGSAVFGSQSQVDVYLCRACAEGADDRNPDACSVCEVPKSDSVELYEDRNSGDFLCTDCWKAQALPTCLSCSKPVTGKCIQVGEKTFHPDCLKCAMCSVTIEGKCSQTPMGFACASCCRSIVEQVEKISEHIDKDEYPVAIEMADKLRALGMPLPPIEPPAYKSLPDCAACGRPATKSSGMIGDKSYHAECLKCSVCSEQIRASDQVAETPVGLTCAQCCDRVKGDFQALQACLANGDQQGAAKLVEKLQGQGVDLPRAGGEKEPSSLPDCAVCGRPAAAGPHGMLGGKLYHSACLKCAVCKSPLGGRIAQTPLGPTCVSCCESIKFDMQRLKELLENGDRCGAAELAAKLKERGVDVPPTALEQDTSRLPACAVCGKPAAAGTYSMFGDKLYHSECLKCAVCASQLQGKIAQTRWGPMCESCCDSIQGDVQQLKGLLENGDQVGAAELAKKLKALGIEMPSTARHSAEQTS